MQVSVKLIGHLLDYLPNEGVAFDGAGFAIDVDITVAKLAAAVGLPEDAEYFVMLNGDHVVEDAWSSRELSEGDEIVFCPPLKGG